MIEDRDDEPETLEEKAEQEREDAELLETPLTIGDTIHALEAFRDELATFGAELEAGGTAAAAISAALRGVGAALGSLLEAVGMEEEEEEEPTP